MGTHQGATDRQKRGWGPAETPENSAPPGDSAWRSAGRGPEGWAAARSAVGRPAGATAGFGRSSKAGSGEQPHAGCAPVIRGRIAAPSPCRWRTGSRPRPLARRHLGSHCLRARRGGSRAHEEPPWRQGKPRRRVQGGISAVSPGSPPMWGQVRINDASRSAARSSAASRRKTRRCSRQGSSVGSQCAPGSAMSFSQGASGTRRTTSGAGIRSEGGPLGSTRPKATARIERTPPCSGPRTCTVARRRTREGAKEDGEGRGS